MRCKLVALCLGLSAASAWLMTSVASARGTPAEIQAQLQREREALAQLVPVEGRAVNFAVSAPVSSFRLPAVPKGGVDGGIVREVDADDVDDDGPVSRSLLEAMPLRKQMFVDPVLQSQPGPESLTVPQANFEGMSQIDNFFAGVPRVLPPDTVGDVGPRHYVEAVNLVYKVFDKAGNALTAPFSEAALFAPLGGICATTNQGDPIVLYDNLADRWILTHFALFSTTVPPFHQCIAVSQTGDPTGAYFLYEFVMPNNKFNDYPKFGVWTDAYYMTDRQFNPGFSGMGAFAYNRGKMLAGDPTASYVYFDVDAVTAFFHGMIPADVDGPPPPAGAPGYFMVSTDDDQGLAFDGLRLFEFAVNFANPAASTFTERPDSPIAGVTSYDSTLNECFGSGAFACINPAPGACTVGVSTATFTSRDDIPQPRSRPTVRNTNACERLDAIADRLMHRLVYRNFGDHETLLAVQTVDANGTPPTQQTGHLAAPHYWNLSRPLPGGNFSVADQGTFAPDAPIGTHRWMPSVAMDHNGNIAVGYSVAREDPNDPNDPNAPPADPNGPANVRPGVRYAGRLSADPPGTLQTESSIVEGGGVQTSNTSRWGDYSGMSVDPADDCTFWFAQEYYAFERADELCPDVILTACWHTRIGSFRFPAPDCISPAQGTFQGSVRDAATFAPIANARVQLVDTTTGAAYETATTGLGSFLRQVLPAGTYTVTVTASNYTILTAANITMTNGATLTRAYTMTALPNLALDSVAVNDAALGNNNGGIDPGECVQLNLSLRNNGRTTASGVSATIASNTPGVTFSTATVPYPNIAPGGTGTNTTPLQVSVAPFFACGTLIKATLTVVTSAATFTIPVTLNTSSAPAPFIATGPVAIPDGTGVTSAIYGTPATLPIVVSGFDPNSTISKVTVTIFVTHTFDSDLRLSLVGPDATSVRLAEGRGSSGDNFGTDCPTTDGDDTTFDDGAAASITTVSAPLVGTFRPQNALTAFNGKSGSALNGTWLLKAEDGFAGDVGAIQCVHLTITTSGCPTGPGVCAGSAPQLAVQSTSVSGGNGDSDVDFNENFNLNVALANTGTADATGVSATLSSTSPGVVILSGTSAYPDILSNTSQTNSTAFQVQSPCDFSLVCGTSLSFSLTVTTAQGTFVVPFTLGTGVIAAPASFGSAGAPIPIPDANLGGAASTIPVTGIIGAINKVTVSVKITHPLVSDLVLRLTAPDGSRSYLSSGNGGAGANYGTDCPAGANDTTFDDAAATAITAGTAPFVGSFRPESVLSVFSGKSGAAVNGNWKLEVVDEFAGSTGTIDCWTLNITAASCDDGGATACLTPTPTNTPTSTNTPTPTITSTPTRTFTLTATPTSTITPTPTFTPTPTRTPTITPTSVISIADVSQREGSGGGTTTFHFRVNVVPARPADTSVDFTTRDGTGTTGATAPSDYGTTSGTLVIPANTPFANVDVPVVADNTFESNESFFVDLSNVIGGGLVGGSGRGTILNDDAATQTPTRTRTPTRTPTGLAPGKDPGAGAFSLPSSGRSGTLLLIALVGLIGVSVAVRRRPRSNR
jgi:subtilisin-like proprotein convertase family protein